MVDALDFSFDSANASTYGFETQYIGKLLQPAQSVKDLDIPKFAGITQVSKKFTKWILPVSGKITGTSYSDLLSKIAAFSAWINSDTDKELIFNNQSTKYYNAQVTEKIDVAIKSTVKAVLIVLFTLNDPYSYAVTADTDTQEDFDTNDDTYVVANSGHTYAYPVITITFNQPQTHIYVDNYTVSNSRFDISKAFIANDELEIDCKNGTVKLNGTADYTGFGSGGQGKANWLKLAVGNNSIYAGTDDADIDVDIVMSFRKVYLY